MFTVLILILLNCGDAEKEPDPYTYLPDPVTGDSAADLVYGQNSFSANISGDSGSEFDAPSYVAVDDTKNIYVTDSLNHRVLIFLNSSNDTVADIIIGTGRAGTSNKLLYNPKGIAVDKNGNLYVADSGNNRILIFLNPVSTDKTADSVLGQKDFNSSAWGSDTYSFNEPVDVAISELLNPSRIAVSDRNNNRVFIFENPLYNDTVPEALIGSVKGTSDTELNSPSGVAIKNWISNLTANK